MLAMGGSAKVELELKTLLCGVGTVTSRRGLNANRPASSMPSATPGPFRLRTD